MRNIIEITDNEIKELLDFIVERKYKILQKTKAKTHPVLGEGIKIKIKTIWNYPEGKEDMIDTIILYNKTIGGTYIQDVLNFDFPHGVQKLYQEFLLIKGFKDSKFEKI